MMTYLPLILSAIAIILSVLAPIIHNHNNDHWDEDELKKIAKSSVKESETIVRIITDKVQSRLTNKEQPKNTVVSKDEIVEEVLEQLKPEIKKMVSETILQVSHQTNSVDAKGEANSNRKKFGFYGEGSFVLSDSPTETSVYSFVTDPKNGQKAWFDVYDVQKVVEDRNFLQGCCSIEGDGSRLLTLEKGLAVCKDGKWVLEKKLKIKFS